MPNFKKEWNNTDIYNFNIEFNRIESYNQYVEKWLKDYFGLNFEPLEHKTDWTIYDVVDLIEFNRVKKNINKLLDSLQSEYQVTMQKLSVNATQTNQIFTSEKANEIEDRLNDHIQYLGNLQFEFNITGLTICGNSNKLGG